MQYTVRFGSAFAVDQFGFVRKGFVSTEQRAVVFQGHKGWPAIAKLCVFLAITVLPWVLFGFGLGFLVALVVIHYFCTSEGTIVIDKSTITHILRNGRRVRFRAQHPRTGKSRNTVFKVDTIENALTLESEIQDKGKLPNMGAEMTVPRVLSQNVSAKNVG